VPLWIFWRKDRSLRSPRLFAKPPEVLSPEVHLADCLGQSLAGLRSKYPANGRRSRGKQARCAAQHVSSLARRLLGPHCKGRTSRVDSADHLVDAAIGDVCDHSTGCRFDHRQRLRTGWRDPLAPKHEGIKR
jgi:hypothetical protein